jgi:uncharacterized protein (TIRG00374 family)
MNVRNAYREPTNGAGEIGKARSSFFLRLSITLIILGLILWKAGGLGEVGRVIAGIDPRFASLTLAVITADRALMTYKWVRLLRSRGIHLPFFRGLRIYCAAMVWGMFLPATMGADAIRAYSTARTGLKLSDIVASIAIERMVGFLAALLLGMISLVLLSFSGSLDGRFTPAWWAGAGLLLAGTLAFAASFSRGFYKFLYERVCVKCAGAPLWRRLRQLHETYLAYRAERAELAIFFGLTFLEQLMPILISWLIALGMGIQARLIFLAGAIPLTMLISRIPISIDGLGVYEGVFAFLMSLAGVPPAQAVAITLVGRVLQTAAWLPWWAAQVISSGNARSPA